MQISLKDLSDILAQWLSAIGTVGAVIVALYLARKDGKPDLILHSGIKKIVGPRWGPSDDRDYMHLSATNLGRNDVKITHLVWRIGFFRKERFLQIPSQTQVSAGLPYKMPHAEEMNIVHPFDELDLPNSPIVKHIAKASYPALLTKTLEFGFHTSVGITFWARPDEKIVTRFLKEAEGKNKK